MSDVKFCPDCGAQLVPGDRFCGDCGFDTATLDAPTASVQMEARPVTVTPTPSASQQTQGAGVPNPAPQPGMPGMQTTAGGNSAAIGVKNSGNKNALVIMISVLAVLFIAGGGVYWWLSKDDSGNGTSQPDANQGQTVAPGAAKDPGASPQMDLTRAATYLSEPGLKMTFFVNYPDGTSGIVDRISGRAVPNEAVRVSEVEVGIDMGEEYGYGFHYVERPDGTYYILDNTPFEIFPVLKNNLTVGQTWNYQTESGTITWTVLDMGVDLDLGFAKFEDCIMVQEDNQAVQFQSTTYYAPGRGSVLVIDPSGATEYYKLTAMEAIDPAQTEQTIIKWCPNYKNIKDDRTQSY